MRILYIAPAFQHPRMRGPTRCFHFLKELSRRHALTLLSLAADPVPKEVFAEVASHVDKLLLIETRKDGVLPFDRALGRLPVVGSRLSRLRERRRAVSRMKDVFEREVERGSYDLVLFHGKSVFPVIEEFDALPVVIDFCDATSLRHRDRMRYARPGEWALVGLRYLLTRQVERKLLRKSRQIAFVSQRDRDAILATPGFSKVVPIGVDHEYWRRTNGCVRPGTVVFTGVMSYAPNEDAALYLIEKVAPLVRQVVPELRVFIVGREPSPRLIRASRGLSGVTVTGSVEDLRPYLEQAAVFAAPLRYGSGVQNKLLEAMAMEVPVVTTSIAAAGLCVGENAHPPVLVADTPERFAESVGQLLNDEAQRNRLGNQGRRYVEENFDWKKSAALIEKLCLDALNEDPREEVTLLERGSKWPKEVPEAWSAKYGEVQGSMRKG
jgi:hypothetical protein